MSSQPVDSARSSPVPQPASDHSNGDALKALLAQRPMASSLQKEATLEVGASRKDSCRLHYELHDTGKVRVLFINGYGTSSSGWEPTVSYLTSTKPGYYEICVFDNRGCGFSDAPWGMYSTSGMAADTVELLDHLGWDKNIHIVGISMGGMISQEIAHMVPRRLASITLLSTHAGLTTPPLTGLKHMALNMTSSDLATRIHHSSKMLFPDSWLEKQCAFDSSITNRDLFATMVKRRDMYTRPTPLQGILGQTAAISRHFTSCLHEADITPRALVR
ncbi:alpha/beta-hydrolase [Ramicandelaber brevisporus]|nr:alpha/beta-hydrolase [Ramicandelaber brevisporus]